MRSVFAGSALIGLALATPAFADAKAGYDAWMAGNYEKAVAEWRGPATAGDPDAQFDLGQAYKLGRGVPADQNTALDWYRKAAAAGHEKAQAALGLQLFQSGKRDEAMVWLKKAADQGEPRAQYVVATAYFNGDSVPKDWARAYALMTRAKVAGIGAASTSLAQMDQMIPDQQRQAGLALAREMERTAALRANDTGGDDSPMTVRTTSTSPTTPPKTTPIAPASPPPSTVAATTPPPQPKPVATKPTPPKPAPATTAAVAPTPGGGWKIQLGAFSNADGARNAWKALSAKVPAIRSLTPYYVPAGAVTRLQAGPLGSRAAVDKACDAVKASGGGCFQIAP